MRRTMSPPRMSLLLHCCTFMALALAPLAAHAQSAGRMTVTDVSGRRVEVPRDARRILIDDGRYLVALALIDPDPVRRLAAWPRDVDRIGTRMYEQYRARFPRLDNLARVPSSANEFSMERTLAVKPDVAVFTLGRGPSAEQVQQLRKVGIPVVFIDFVSRPFQNLEPSLRILGQLVGRQAAADSFIAFRQERLELIADRLRANPPATTPTVFFEAHAGMSEDCCNSPGKGNVGDYITLVGGHNIGADVLPGAYGRLNIEYVLSRNPSVYIATGGPHLEKAGGLVVGPGYSVARARASLKAVSARPGVSLLPAVARGNVHGLSHQLLNSPLDILAIEALARWVHPSLFRDLDPQRTMAEINSRFLAVPLEGTYWVDQR